MRKVTIGIVGAGVLGCVISTMLTNAGYDVELAKVYKSQLELADDDAINISGEWGDHETFVRSCKGIEKFSSLKDYIFMLCKAQDVKKFTTIALKYLTPDGKIVTMQNVLTLYDILQVTTKDKLIGLILGWSAIKIDFKSMSIVSNGINVLGSFCPGLDKSLKELKEILNSVSQTYITNNILGLAMSRLIINSCINSLGCITGARLGNLMEIRNVKRLFEGLFKEDMEVAKAMGIKIVPYCKEFDYYELMKPGILTYIRRRRKLAQLGRQNPYVVSSTLRYIENNKPSEVQYITGFFVNQGKRLNIKTPLNSRLLEMIEDIENHEIGIFPDNALDYYLRHPNKYIDREKEFKYVNRRY